MSGNPLSGLSADVAAILGHAERQEEVANLPKWKRNQVKRDRARVKITLDLTDYPQVAQKLREFAEGEHCGISGMAVHLLALGIDHYRSPNKRPSRSQKHAFDVVINDKF